MVHVGTMRGRRSQLLVKSFAPGIHLQCVPQGPIRRLEEFSEFIRKHMLYRQVIFLGERHRQKHGCFCRRKGNSNLLHAKVLVIHCHISGGADLQEQLPLLARVTCGALRARLYFVFILASWCRTFLYKQSSPLHLFRHCLCLIYASMGISDDAVFTRGSLKLLS